MKEVYLKGTEFKFKQKSELYKYNTDTYLLGTFLDFKKGSTVMDVGTNTGALLLYASLLKPSKLIGVDINEIALGVAKENLELNGLEAELIHSRIQDLKHEQVDVIICNPPFFKANKVRENEYYNWAMFETYMPLDEAFTAFKRLLKDNGTLYLNYPADRLNEVFKVCESHKFKIMKIVNIFEESKPTAFRSLIKLKRGVMSEVRVGKPLFLKNSILVDPKIE